MYLDWFPPCIKRKLRRADLDRRVETVDLRRPLRTRGAVSRPAAGLGGTLMARRDALRSR
jgi:hypothetical protein